MRENGRPNGRVTPALALVVLALVFAIHPVRAEFEERRTIGASNLTVYNVIGEVQVRGSSGSDFEVRVNVRGADASPDRVHVEVKEGDRAELAVVFPLDEVSSFVYPRLGKDSRTTFSMSKGDSWLGRLLAGVGRDRITVRGSGSGMEVWADVEVLVPSGSTVTIRHGAGEIEASEITGDVTLDSHSGPVTVRSVDGRLSVDTGSGRVRAEDLRGRAVIDTGSGSVEVVRFAGDDLDIDTGSGRVELEDIDTRSLGVDTGSGGVTAAAIRTDSAEIDTGSGGITLDLERMGAGDYRLDTGSGSIVLAVPPDASASVHAETGSGGIYIDLDEGVQIRHKERDEITFRIGDGAARIEMDTGSGSIRIKHAD